MPKNPVMVTSGSTFVTKSFSSVVAPHLDKVSNADVCTLSFPKDTVARSLQMDAATPSLGRDTAIPFFQWM